VRSPATIHPLAARPPLLLAPPCAAAARAQPCVHPPPSRHRRAPLPICS